MKPRISSYPAAVAALLLAALFGAAAPAHADGIVFRRSFDNDPIKMDLRPGDPMTDALKKFYAGGENPYKGKSEAIAQGLELYTEFCQPCHMPGAAGKIGPSLIDDVYLYPRTGTDLGMFEVLMAGAFGAMRTFADRLSQDEMLKVLAYVRSLKK